MSAKKSQSRGPSIELKAFSALLREDIEDALTYEIPPAQVAITLLIYAAHLCIEHDAMDAEEYINYAVSSWNETASALEDEPWLLQVYDEGKGPVN